MRYYLEEKTHKLREKVEKEVLGWPKVSTKKMFGCPCYKRDGKLFASLVTEGIVITHISDEDREKLSRLFQTGPFHAGKRIVDSWLRIPIININDIDKIMPFVRKSYKYVL